MTPPATHATQVKSFVTENLESHELRGPALRHEFVTGTPAMRVPIEGGAQ
jgi:hypothetical protein